MAQLSDFTYRARFTFESQGADKVRADNESVARSQDNINRATEHGERASKFYSQSVTRLEGSLISQMRATDKVFRAEQDLIKTRSRLQALADKGGVISEEHIKLLNHYESALRKVSQAENDNVKATDNMVAALTRWQKGQFTATLDAWTAKLREAKKAAEETAAANRTLTESMAKNMTGMMSAYGGRTSFAGPIAQFNAGEAARAERERTAADAALRGSLVSGMGGSGGRDQTAIRMGLAATKDRTRRLTVAMSENADAGKRMAEGLSAVGVQAARDADFINKMSLATNNATAKQGGLTKLQRLTVQQTFGDVISSLSTGQSPQTILLQQGEQFLQPFGTGMEGIKNAASQLGPMLMRLVFNPITLIGSAALTTAYAMSKWKDSQDAVAVSLNGLAKQAGLTLSQINAIAAATSNASTISNASARTYATMFAGAGVNGSAIQPGLGLVDPLSRRLGVDQGDMAKTLADALASPGKGAEELARKYALLTYAEEEQIKQLSETGEKTKAAAKLVELLGGKIKEMEDPTTRFSAALDQAKKGFLNFIDAIGREAKQSYNPDSFDTVRSRIIRAQQDEKDAKSSRAARNLTDLYKKYNPDKDRWDQIDRQFQSATVDMNTPGVTGMLGDKAGAAAEGFDRLRIMRENFVTADQKVRQSTDASTKAMTTLNEKTKAEITAQQSYKETLQESGDRQLAAARADSVRADALARTSVAMRDFNKEARNQLDLAGLSPYEKSKRQIQQEGKQFADQYGAVPSGVADKLAALQKEAVYSQLTQPTLATESELDILARKNEVLGESIEKTAQVVAWHQKYNELVLQGVEITPAIIDQINTYAESQGQLAQATEDAARKQQYFTDALDMVRSTAMDVGTSLAEAFRRGENAGKAMMSVLDRLLEKLLDKSLNMAIDGLFGKMGGSSGGIFGSLLGGLFGGGPSMVTGGLGGMAVPTFAMGGVMTSAGPLPLHAYAAGGVADRPQLAMFGEGSRPEAYVPLPDGRNIPVKMQGQTGAKVTINNYSNNQVEARQMNDGEILVTVQNMIAANNRKVPGLVADAQRRSM